MRHRSDVPPSTLSVDLTDGGITVEYTDGREVFYHGVPDRAESPVRTGRRREVHVLVTDARGTEGVLTYVNDRATHDDVLESTGVGRVLLEPGETEELFPGVTVEMDDRVPVVAVDHDLVDGRVFVFEESAVVERSYEVVAETAEGDADGAETAEGSTGPTGADAGPSGGA